MQALSLAWGILALIGMVVGFIPCLGWMNWVNIPFAFAGLIFSIIAHIVSRGRNRQNSMVAIILCILAILLGSKRLVAGFGIF
jgi:predicted PurR-regulated permease PerM